MTTKNPPADPEQRHRFDRAVIAGGQIDRAYEHALAELGSSSKDRMGSPLEWLALLRAEPAGSRN